MTLSPEELTTEKKKEHGDWLTQSNRSRIIKTSMHNSVGWSGLESYQKEALDMIAVKMSRILSGDANLADHWDDIAGYAFLGKGGHED